MWNWQLKNWPAFKFAPDEIGREEAEFLHGSGLLLGAFATLGEGDVEKIRVDLLSDEALETSRIEGEFLNRESLQSSVRRQFGLTSDGRKVTPAEQGVAEVLVDVYRNFQDELTVERLCLWQAKLMKGRRGMVDIGKLRTSAEPMQIVSGPIHDHRVHFEAPPSKAVPAEMERFIRWFNESRSSLPALTRAAIAHVYFESIHPFEDGNGRVGRAIAELALSQSLGKPVLLALSQAIGAGKKRYYDELGRANRTLEVSAWVKYFAETVLEAQTRAGRHVDFIVQKTKFFDRFRGKLNPRQEKVVLRIFAEGPDGFEGGLSAGNYVSIAKTSAATVTRDLNELVEIGALEKTGEKRYARYWLKLA